MALAIADGIKFFISKNNVILSPGEGEEGVLKPKYFTNIIFNQNGIFKEIAPKPFKYLLVLDFEANCVETGSMECQEIIEFPVVPFNTETMEFDGEPFHHYIKPRVVPEITQFCTELTGITQEQVNTGILLEEALEKLEEWKSERGYTPQNSIFVTCGAWDLKSCLKRETDYKKINYSSHLKMFINIKEVYLQVFMTSKQKGMPGMLEDLNLELDGRHHSGIDDSKNIVKIAKGLIQKGGSFTQYQTRIVKNK